MDGNRREVGGQRDFAGNETENRPVLVRLLQPDKDGNFWVVALRDETSRIKFGLTPDKTKPLVIMEEGFWQPAERKQAFEFANGALQEAKETERFNPKPLAPVEEGQTQFPI